MNDKPIPLDRHFKPSTGRDRQSEWYIRPHGLDVLQSEYSRTLAQRALVGKRKPFSHVSFADRHKARGTSIV